MHFSPKKTFFFSLSLNIPGSPRVWSRSVTSYLSPLEVPLICLSPPFLPPQIDNFSLVSPPCPELILSAPEILLQNPSSWNKEFLFPLLPVAPHPLAANFPSSLRIPTCLITGTFPFVGKLVLSSQGHSPPFYPHLPLHPPELPSSALLLNRFTSFQQPRFGRDPVFF